MLCAGRGTETNCSLLELRSLAHPQYFLISLGCGEGTGEEVRHMGQEGCKKSCRTLNDSVKGKSQVNASLSSNQES